MTLIRDPVVAGQFYPARADELSTTVQVLLDEAGSEAGAAPKALIVPHAGYIYSGPVAATAYSRLLAHRSRYERVVLLGPCHRVPFNGLAFSSAEAFRTPLGVVPLDSAAMARVESPDIRVFDQTHAFEHSLEVHLPFLQIVLDSFTLVPIVVGSTSTESVADVIDDLWDGPGTLIVVSSDLSHYQGYEQARRMDRATCAAIEALEPGRIDHDSACGATPIGGLLVAAGRHGLTVETLDLRNSADTAGNGDQVVGYGAWQFTEPVDGLRH